MDVSLIGQWFKVTQKSVVGKVAFRTDKIYVRATARVMEYGVRHDELVAFAEECARMMRETRSVEGADGYLEERPRSGLSSEQEPARSRGAQVGVVEEDAN